MKDKHIYTDYEIKHMRRECAEYLAKKDREDPCSGDALEDLFFNGHPGWANLPINEVIRFWEAEVLPNEED